MPKSLFEIQTESGQLWIDIQAHFASNATAAADAAKAASESHAAALATLTASHAEAIATKDAELTAQAAINDAALDALNASAEVDKAAAVEAEGKAVHARLDGLVAAGQAARADKDWDAMDKVLEAAYGYTGAARRAAIEAELAAAQAAAEAAAAKLAAL